MEDIMNYKLTSIDTNKYCFRPSTKEFGLTIKKLIKEKNIAIEELADQCYVTTKAVERWIQGHCYPELETLITLANILGVSIQSLIQPKASCKTTYRFNPDNNDSYDIFYLNETSLDKCERFKYLFIKYFTNWLSASEMDEFTSCAKEVYECSSLSKKYFDKDNCSIKEYLSLVDKKVKQTLFNDENHEYRLDDTTNDQEILFEASKYLELFRGDTFVTDFVCNEFNFDHIAQILLLMSNIELTALFSALKKLGLQNLYEQCEDILSVVKISNRLLALETNIDLEAYNDISKLLENDSFDEEEIDKAAKIYSLISVYIEELKKHSYEEFCEEIGE